MFHITQKPFGKIHHQKGVKAKTIVKYGFKYINGLNANGLENLATILGQRFILLKYLIPMGHK